MNLDNLQRKLIDAARAQPPSSRVPYAFDQRILNRIRKLGAVDHWAPLAGALWRAAAPCVALALVLAALSVLRSPGSSPPVSSTDFSQELENTVLAAATVEQPAPDSLR